MTHYNPAAAYQGPHQDVYESGYLYGRQDAQEGLAAMHHRHSHRHETHQRDAFIEGYRKAHRNYSRPATPNQPVRLKTQVGQGQVVVMEGARQVAVLRTASPNIEAHHFVNNRNQVVVKSRVNHEPATVELFDARTGRLQDKVLAYAIRYGEPAWARGMQD